MEITIKSVTHCPTCGSECKVEGDTTHYYVPVKKYTEEDMIAFAYQFSNINVADFRKHLKDFDINLKEKNK